MDRRYLVAGFFFGVLLFLLYIFLQILRPFYFVIFWAATLAIVFYPVQERFERWFQGRKAPAAGVVTFLILLALLIPLTLVATTLGAELVDAFGQVKGYLSKENINRAMNSVLSMFPHAWFEFAEEKLGIHALSDPETMEGIFERIASGVVSLIPIGAKGFLVGILYLAILVFTLFFFLRDGPGLVRNLKSFLPMSQDQKDRIFKTFYEILHSVIAGVLITAAVQAGMVALLLIALGLPYPILGAVITFIGGTLPIGGASLVWLPGSIILFLTGHVWKGAILLAVGALVVSSIDNIVKPMIIGGRARIPTLLLFFSILGGLKLFGFTGILLGPSILAVFLSLLDIYRREYQAPGDSAKSPPPA
ncbi:MAG: AI-2E family transporter [Nitrospirae bacterium]|nr:AI-2E family transporter [Nitrospirota bacterium]